MSHLEQRLAERNITISMDALYAVASKYQQDTAVIIKRCAAQVRDNSQDYYTRNSSNGDLVVLIVRAGRPVTIMYRRSSQSNNANQLSVNRIVYDIIQ